MVLPLLLSIALVGPPAQSGAVADPAAPGSTLWIDAGTWGTVAGPSLAAEPAAVSLRESPKAERTAMLAVGTDQTLSFSLFDGSSWSSRSVLASDGGTDDTTTSDAAFESSSGRLLIAYRRGSSSLVYFRVYDADESPALSGEDWFDLGLPGAPSRVLLRPRPGSDDVLLVGASGTTIRAAVWEGTDFADTTTLDGSFDNDPGAIDAEWSGPTAHAVWARSTDTTPRGSEFADGVWAPSLGLPTVADPIRRVRLAPSSDRGTRALLLTLSTSDGADLGLHAATLADEAWTAATTLSAALAHADGFASSWETAGGGAVAVWQETGQTTLAFSRWDGSGWAAPAPTAELGGVSERIVARPGEGDDAGVRALTAVVSEDASLNDYLVYASAGSLSLGSGTTVNGLAGEGEGFVLPDPPAVSATGPDLSLSNNSTASPGPGVYGDLSIGNSTTLNLTSGDYVFGALVGSRNGLTLNADTSGGPITLTLCDGDFDVRNMLTILTAGPGPVQLHVLSGDFLADNSAEINASVIVHSGDLELGNNALTTAHLVASGNVSVGLSGVLDEPVWDSPFVDPTFTPTFTTRLVGLVVSSGSAGPPVTITDGWGEPHAMPFDLSWKRPTAGVRVTSWREVPSYTDQP